MWQSSFLSLPLFILFTHLSLILPLLILSSPPPLSLSLFFLTHNVIFISLPSSLSLSLTHVHVTTSCSLLLLHIRLNNTFCSQVAQYLSKTYGDKAPRVAEMAQFTGRRWPVKGKRIVEEFPYIEANVLYAIKEYACTAIDVIARRTSLAFLDVQAAEEALPRVVEIMGKELSWSKEEKKVL